MYNDIVVFYHIEVEAFETDSLNLYHLISPLCTDEP